MNRRTALRILALAASIGLVGQALLLGNLLGVNAPILTAALLAAAWVVRPAERRMDPLDAWLPIGALALSLGIAVRADPVLDMLDAAAACALLGASMGAIAGLAITRRSVLVVVELGFIVLGWAGIGVLRVAAGLSMREAPNDDRASDTSAPPRRTPAWAIPVLRGLLIALPLVLVFTSLLASADAVFDRLVGHLFVWRFDLGEVPIRFAIAFFVAWPVAGLLAVATGRAIEPPDIARRPAPAGSPAPQSLGAAAAGLPASDDRALVLPVRLGAIEAATILLAIDVLFGVFVALQLAYLFGGLDTLAATGVPYAQYARSGFFELVRVAFLAGVVLAVVHAVAARRTRLLLGAGLTLVGLTAVVLASALLRLRIYQDAYGWTELRFYVLAAIVWLALGLAITAILLVRDRMRWLLHGLAMAALVVLVGINVVGPSRVIAEQNVARVIDPRLVPPDGRSGLDVIYARRLGDDAIPALVRVLPALSGSDQSVLQRRLIERRAELLEEATDWPSWNLGREAAREALASLAP